MYMTQAEASVQRESQRAPLRYLKLQISELHQIITVFPRHEVKKLDRSYLFSYFFGELVNNEACCRHTAQSAWLPSNKK